MSDVESSTVPPEEPTAQQDPQSMKTAQNLAMVCHLLGLLILTGIPLANILGRLVLWLIKKDELPLVNEHGKESVNFQITVTIGLLACIPFFFVIIGFFLGPAILIADVVLVIIAAMKANEGEFYRYPFCLRLIK